MKAWIVLAALLLPVPALAAGAEGNDCADMLASVGEPEHKAADIDGDMLCRDGYVLFHNDEHRTPDWVVEVLRPERFKGPANRKKLKDPFAPDPDLAKGARAELKDYAKSGFDRGHMAPAADMKYKVEAMRESFYLSNMAPQIGIGLNRHIWADLEALARHWTCDRGQIVVITGPIYERAKPKTIGENDVAVPDGFYKIAYNVERQRAIAFALPNKKVDTAKMKPEDALKPFITSIRDIEQRTGLDFLTAFNKKAQDRLELGKSPMWNVKRGCDAQAVADN